MKLAEGPKRRAELARLLIHVEGETEETFVNEVLAPHLYRTGFQSVSAKLLGNARMRDRRGGIRGWASVRGDFIRHLRQDAGCFATLMVDYYGLPKTGNRAWPGRDSNARSTCAERALLVQQALLTEIETAMGGDFDNRRFIPYVVMHEFEGLLFSDCSRFAEGICRPELSSEFQKIRDGFSSPEEINDSPLTAPSKRVEMLVAGYQKPLLGSLAALTVGLDAIRSSCPLFDSWLKALESLVPEEKNPSTN